MSKLKEGVLYYNSSSKHINIYFEIEVLTRSNLVKDIHMQNIEGVITYDSQIKKMAFLFNEDHEEVILNDGEIFAVYIQGEWFLIHIGVKKKISGIEGLSIRLTR